MHTTHFDRSISRFREKENTIIKIYRNLSRVPFPKFLCSASLRASLAKDSAERIFHTFFISYIFYFIHFVFHTFSLSEFSGVLNLFFLFLIIHVLNKETLALNINLLAKNLVSEKIQTTSMKKLLD